MAIILQYGRHWFLLNAFCIKMDAVSQKRWVDDKSYIFII